MCNRLISKTWWAWLFDRKQTFNYQLYTSNILDITVVLCCWICTKVIGFYLQYLVDTLTAIMGKRETHTRVTNFCTGRISVWSTMHTSRQQWQCISYWFSDVARGWWWWWIWSIWCAVTPPNWQWRQWCSSYTNRARVHSVVRMEWLWARARANYPNPKHDRLSL